MFPVNDKSILPSLPEKQETLFCVNDNSGEELIIKSSVTKLSHPLISEYRLVKTPVES